MSQSAENIAKALRGGLPVALGHIESLMQEKDIDVLGVVYNFISDANGASAITPGLNEEQVYDFLRHYFCRCIEESPSSKWADSRYSACWDAANWLNKVWSDLSSTQRQQWKDWLSAMYLRNGPPVRKAIETGLLEHIFVNRSIATSFSDWATRTELDEAYRISLSVARKLKH